jgi:Fic family protein
MPFNADAMGEVMPVLFGLLFEEPEACVRAVLGHFMFELIHPYMEGNGRMGRLLMNTMLASGGYPWTVIPVTMKTAYRQSLERARTEKDIRSFSKLVASLVNQSIRGKALAVPSVLK